MFVLVHQRETYYYSNLFEAKLKKEEEGKKEKQMFLECMYATNKELPCVEIHQLMALEHYLVEIAAEISTGKLSYIVEKLILNDSCRSNTYTEGIVDIFLLRYTLTNYRK